MVPVQPLYVVHSGFLP